jgi:hypothetical protein
MGIVNFIQGVKGAVGLTVYRILRLVGRVHVYRADGVLPRARFAPQDDARDGRPAPAAAAHRGEPGRRGPVQEQPKLAAGGHQPGAGEVEPQGVEVEGAGEVEPQGVEVEGAGE